MKGIQGLQDKTFEAVVRILLILIVVIIIFPIFFVLSASFTPYEEVIKNGGFLIIPHKITLEAYEYLFKDYALVTSFGNSLFVTIAGTICNLIVTALAAWPLSRKKLPARSLIMVFITFTLVFSGGTIPTYLVVREFKLLDSLWSMIIPTLVATTNLIILKNFMEALPEELMESAVVDGASDIRIFLKIVLPLSVPILMTVAIYYGVGHWNDFFSAILYITSRMKMPMQVILREILMASRENTLDVERVLPTMTLQMAAVVTTSLPIILVYPFVQKAFIRGIMAGALKG
jgi:putative aldouronate transport system permease protein